MLICVQVIPAAGSELKQREADRHTHTDREREGWESESTDHA